jgi:hypothetical protein
LLFVEFSQKESAPTFLLFFAKIHHLRTVFLGEKILQKETDGVKDEADRHKAGQLQGVREEGGQLAILPLTTALPYFSHGLPFEDAVLTPQLWAHFLRLGLQRKPASLSICRISSPGFSSKDTQTQTPTCSAFRPLALQNAITSATFAFVSSLCIFSFCVIFLPFLKKFHFHFVKNNALPTQGAGRVLLFWSVRKDGYSGGKATMLVCCQLFAEVETRSNKIM